MGVFGTFCQICAMPVQHNCYVPYEGMYAIYRGRESYPAGHPLPAFPFGPEHAWLRQAVALRLSPEEEPQVVRGEVQDGELEVEGEEGVFVAEGEEDRAALHERCWELAGRAEWDELAGVRERPGWREVEAFHGQLFEFDELSARGLAWMAVDPDWDSAEGRRSRARILALLEADESAEAAGLERGGD